MIKVDTERERTKTFFFLSKLLVVVSFPSRAPCGRLGYCIERVFCRFFLITVVRLLETSSMGWIPCSGYSGTKNKVEKMEAQDSLVGQIKATPGKKKVFCFLYRKKETLTEL